MCTYVTFCSSDKQNLFELTILLQLSWNIPQSNINSFWDIANQNILQYLFVCLITEEVRTKAIASYLLFMHSAIRNPIKSERFTYEKYFLSLFKLLSVYLWKRFISQDWNVNYSIELFSTVFCSESLSFHRRL